MTTFNGQPGSCFDQAEHMDAMCGEGWSEIEGGYRYENRSPLHSMAAAKPDMTRCTGLAAFMDALILRQPFTLIYWSAGRAQPIKRHNTILAQAAE